MADSAPSEPHFDNAGASMADLVSTQKGGVQNLSQVVRALINAFPVATASSSPSATAINNLSSSATALIGTSLVRHGIIFHNPGTANAYIYPSTLGSTPTTASLGGTFLILPGADREFPSSLFANVNCGWSGFVATGSSQPLTVVEFF